MGWPLRIASALAQRVAQDRLRQRSLSEPDAAGALMHAGVRYRNFAGNDYLGLSQDARLIEAWQQGAARYGVGAGASGHVTGYQPPHARLEEQLADWLGYPRALLFNSGFAANQAAIAALATKGDRILADRLAHASLLEAAHLSPATLRRFGHNQPHSLQRLLMAPHDGGETLVISEGVFSMDGDCAPLAALQQLTQQAGGWLMVDDAHGIGVQGEQGRGSCWQQQVKPALLVVTFGKAFGVSGAAILCDEATAGYLLQFARHLIYSTAMPPAQACALLAALRAVQQGGELRQRLQDNIQRFRSGAQRLAFTLTPSATPIQPLLVGEEGRTLALAARLRQRGCWVAAIRPPTVPSGTARLRITLSASHSAADIDALLESLYDAQRE